MIKGVFPIKLDDRLLLRPFRITDAIPLALHANNRKIADNLNDGFPYPYTELHALEFIGSLKDDTTPAILAIVINDEPIGAVGVFPQTKVQRLNAEIGYWIGERYWGQGIATKVLIAMVRYVFENFNYIRLFTRPFPSNIASIRVIEKAGFTLEAKIKNGLCKNDMVFDELIYSIRREDTA